MNLDLKKAAKITLESVAEIPEELKQNLHSEVEHLSSACTAILNSEVNTESFAQKELLMVFVEGLDGSGKTTLCQDLHEILAEGKFPHKVVKTPPESVLQLRRAWFDKQTEDVKRSFFYVTNYISLREIEPLTKTIIIVDRHWPSTVAYNMAYSLWDAKMWEELPPADSEYYKWSDELPLIKNSVLVVLKVDEDERKRRIRERCGLIEETITEEEEKLEKDKLFRQTVQQAYDNIAARWREKFGERKIEEIDTTSKSRKHVRNTVYGMILSQW